MRNSSFEQSREERWGSIIDDDSIFPRCSPSHVCVCNFLVPMFALTRILPEGPFLQNTVGGQRTDQEQRQTRALGCVCNPPSPATYLSFSSTPFFAGVCSAGKETGGRSGVRKTNRGQRKGVCENVPFVAGGEKHLWAPGQDAGGKQ